MKRKIKYSIIMLVLILPFFNMEVAPTSVESNLSTLLPQVSSWEQSEEPQLYLPETLFEYINGAAEIYLAYEFNGLIVAQYRGANSESNVAVEIYDMGSDMNSFGIYSAERYPDNNFIDIGVQGYLDEGSLNFLAGRYYVKLLCFECVEHSDGYLKEFAQAIMSRVKSTEAFPSLLSALPREGLLANTEKFILRNFMGYSFLHNGFLANYKLQDLEFDCFLIQGNSPGDASSMIERFLQTRNRQDVQKITGGYHIQDKYYHHIYLATEGRYICGVMKIKDGYEKVGEEYLARLIQNLKD